MSVSESLETRPSVCPLDCPDTCSLSVTTDGKSVLKVRGSSGNPFTAGVICDKVSRSYPDFVHGSARLTTPLRRVGAKGDGAFVPISWDEALDLVYEGFDNAIAMYGPQSVLPFNYAGPHGELAGGSMDRRFFHRLGASQLSRGPLCGIVRGTAYTSVYGNAPGMPPEQARHADLIIVWGNNVTVSNLHLVRTINATREDGAKLIIVDPKRTKIAEQADIFVQIRPGTDVVLAMGLAAELERRDAFDDTFIADHVAGVDAYMAQARQYTPGEVEAICGVSPELLGALADHYQAARSVACSIGNGIERGRSGSSGLRAAMALQALTGNHGRLGAGVIAKSGLSFPKTTAKLQRPDLVPEGTRTINIVDVGEALLDTEMDPPIAATFIYNHNPVCTHPDQNRMRRGLSRPDLFVVGSDVVMTDSLAYADVILPAASHFEFDDIYGAYGHHYLQRAEPVIPPVGEALPNTEIFRRLAARFGFNDPIFKESDAELMDAAFDPADPRLEGHRPSTLPLDRAFAMNTTAGDALIMCDTVMPATPSGKIELFCQDLEDRFGYGVPRFEPVEKRYPLSVISPSSSKRTNATFGAGEPSQGLEIVEIHPDDAAARGVETDTVVRLRNERGSVHLKAVVTDAVLPGVLYTPKGTWLATSPTGQTINALLDADIRTDIEDGACYNETFCEVEVVS